jgi:hypothetical protein
MGNEAIGATVRAWRIMLRTRTGPRRFRCACVTDNRVFLPRRRYQLRRRLRPASLVTDAGVKELTASNLTALNLNSTRVTDEGVRELTKLLPRCSILNEE